MKQQAGKDAWLMLFFSHLAGVKLLTDGAQMQLVGFNDL